MAKQKKSCGSDFFDKMEEKMQIEGNKRRKLNKKPELLFLQFNPDNQDLDPKSKTFHSQPSSNISKKKWTPPLKCPKAPDFVDFCKSKKMGLLSMYQVIDKCCSTKLDAALDNSDIYFNKEIIEIHSSPVKSQTSNIEVNHNPTKHTETNINCISLDANLKGGQNNVNIIGFQTSTSQENTDSRKTIPNSISEETVIDKSYRKEEDFLYNLQNDRNSINGFNCKNESPICSENNVEIYNGNFTATLNRNCITGKIAHKDYSLQTKNISQIQENEISQNFNAVEISIRDINHSNHEESSCENNDIINSIDLILSEGESTFKKGNITHFKNIAHVINCSEALRDKESDENLVDSVFDGSDSDTNDDFQNGINNNNSIKLIAESDVDLIAKDSVAVNKCLPESIDYCILDKESVDHVRNNIPTTNLVLEEDEFDQIVHENTNAPIETEDNKNCDIRQEIKKAVISEMDEDNSCLMISNSQLLEIEKTYCNNTSILGNTNKSIFSVPNDNYCLSTSIKCKNRTVGTQTDLIQEKLQMDDQSKLVAQVAPVQWPKKMQDAQKRLREVVQEVDRLNATLLKVRQQIWPVRHRKTP